MAVTMAEPQRLDRGAWRFSWSSDLPDPTFRVTCNGQLLDTTAATSLVLHAEAGETLLVEVRDDEGDPAEAWPSRFTLVWYRVDGAAAYRVDELVGASWIQRAQVADDGRTSFRWRTRPLEDCAVHHFRIVPLGENGNEGSALALSLFMVHHPDPPQVSYAYNASNRKVTLTEA